MDSDARDTNAHTGALRPFVGGRPPVQLEPQPAASAPRPFPFAVRRVQSAEMTGTATLTIVSPEVRGDTPRWTVAVYEPGIEQGLAVESPESALGMRLPANEDGSSTEDLADNSLALESAIRDATRHEASFDAASVLEAVAHRLRSGEILLPAGVSPRNEAAVIAAVLAALLEGRR